MLLGKPTTFFGGGGMSAMVTGIGTLKGLLLAAMRHSRTYVGTRGKSQFLTVGKGLHLGAGVRLWAPDHLRLGNYVYLGKDVLIECNASIGDYCMLANRVALIGRHDHDYRCVGTPIRFAPWIGGSATGGCEEEVSIADDVWIGFGSIVLTGTQIGRGAIVGAGSVVVRNVEPYAIVAGTPARQVGVRMPEADRARHEATLREGCYKLSERGLQHCVVQPRL